MPLRAHFLKLKHDSLLIYLFWKYAGQLQHIVDLNKGKYTNKFAFKVNAHA